MLAPSNNCNSNYDSNFPHGTSVVPRLTSPWFCFNWLVLANSVLLFLARANALFDYGLTFTDVAINAARHFPMSFLSGVEFIRLKYNTFIEGWTTEAIPILWLHFGWIEVWEIISVLPLQNLRQSLSEDLVRGLMEMKRCFWKCKFQFQIFSVHIKDSASRLKGITALQTG